jgi:hypothetical protein
MKCALAVSFALTSALGCSSDPAPDLAQPSQQSVAAEPRSIASNEMPYCTNAAICRPSGGGCCNNKFRDGSCRSGYRCCRVSGGSCINGTHDIWDTCCSHICNLATNLCL